MKNFKYLLLLTVLQISCSDKVGEIQDAETQRGVLQDATPPDIAIIQIPDVTVDAWIDPCADLQNTDEMYCQCNPRCCQEQTWYCPPRGTEVLAKHAILDICGEDLIPCDRSQDPNCPPAEIIYESQCNHAFDCPPGINEDFRMYYDCEIEGVSGIQEVRCDKGRLFYGECITCEATEEVCDAIDNDCDGIIDENQRNACDLCGAVPEEICDGNDNDCDGNIDEELVRECSTVCNSGLEVCDSGNWIGCTAQVPFDEQCDGSDSDCDGLVDEGLNCQCPPAMVGSLMPCMENPLNCGMGFKTCECVNEQCDTTQMTECFAICHWFPEVLAPDQQCDPLQGTAVNPEVCNNFDEDCDNMIDEQLVRACYTGPEGTINVGLCSPGEQTCNSGQWYGQAPSGNYVADFCGGETVPTEEVCDGADNDCDGVTDFGEEIPDTDILFIVDWSGSMENTINAVRMAMNRFAQTFQAEDALKWGLLVGPKALPNEDEALIMETDITEFDNFLQSFASVGIFDNQTGNEMLRDAILLAIKNVTGNLQYDFLRSQWGNGIASVPELQDFTVTWRRNSDKVIIIFTDEEDQSYLAPNVTPQVLLDAIDAAPRTKLYVFTSVAFSWRDYAQASGGRTFGLTINQERMYNDLMSILDEICQSSPRQEPQQEQAYNFRNNLSNTYQAVSLKTGVKLDFSLLMCY